MTKLQISVLALVGLVLMIGVAQAVRPSGPGQTTAANSLSVAVASDQTVPVTVGTASVRSAAPQTAGAVTPSDEVDAGFPSCTHSLYVGDPDAGTLTAIPCGGDAGVLFSGLAAGSRIPGCFSRILATGTTAGSIVCQGF